MKEGEGQLKPLKLRVHTQAEKNQAELFSQRSAKVYAAHTH
jgi:hypothetical protein